MIDYIKEYLIKYRKSQYKVCIISYKGDSSIQIFSPEKALWFSSWGQFFCVSHNLDLTKNHNYGYDKKEIKVVEL